MVEAADLWRVAIFAPSDRATPIEPLAFALFAAAGGPTDLPELAEGDYANAEALAALFACGGGAATRPIEKALERAAANARRDDAANVVRPALLFVVDQLGDLFVAGLRPRNE